METPEIRSIRTLPRKSPTPPGLPGLTVRSTIPIKVQTRPFQARRSAVMSIVASSSGSTVSV